MVGDGAILVYLVGIEFRYGGNSVGVWKVV